MSSGVNSLTGCPKILNLTEKGFFADFRKFWKSLIRWLIRGFQKQDLLRNKVTTFFESIISEARKLRGSFFFKMFKTESTFEKLNENTAKYLLFFK